jgi:hypothetical protein
MSNGKFNDGRDAMGVPKYNLGTRILEDGKQSNMEEI